jgi:hypothetical protein
MGQAAPVCRKVRQRGAAGQHNVFFLQASAAQVLRKCCATASVGTYKPLYMTSRWKTSHFIEM